MKLGEYTAEVLNALTAGALQKLYLKAGTVPGDDDPNASDYRRLSASERDMNPLAYDRAMKLSFATWQRNPIASRMVQIPLDFIFGDEFNVQVVLKERTSDGVKTVETTEPQDIWDRFYEHPANNLDEGLPQFFQDLLINGELPLPVTVNTQADHAVYLGYFDPINIIKVQPNARNIRQIDSVTFRVPNTTDEETIQVVNYDMRPTLGAAGKNPAFGRLNGDLLYYRLKHVTNQTRGNGLLVDVVDWLDSLDQFLFGSLEGLRIRNAFIWHLVIDGADEAELKEHRKNTKAPRPGSLKITNDKAHWNAITPELGSMDIESALKTFQRFIVGNKGYPYTWFGSGEDANRSSGQEMGIPTMRMMKRLQRKAKGIIRHMARYVTDQAAIGGMTTIGPDQFVDVNVSMFDFERKGVDSVGAAFTSLVTSLVLAKQNNWITDETGKRVVDNLLGNLGVEVDDDQTAEDIARENAGKDEDNAMRGQPPANRYFPDDGEGEDFGDDDE